MTISADRALLADLTAGRIKTREEHLIRHVGTIDSEAELDGFADELTASGGMTGNINVAILRRQKQIGAMKWQPPNQKTRSPRKKTPSRR